jgi:hypothetical protein
MEFAFLSRDRRAAAGAIAVFLAGAAFAQAPDQPTMTPDRSAPRQPTPSSVQQAETREAEQQESDADRKLREMDRKMNRVMRSICIGC